jgi:serine/threonine protein kinase
LTSELPETVVEPLATPTPAELERYGHDFMVLPEATREALIAFAVKVSDALAASDAKPRLPKPDLGKALPDFADTWLARLAQVIDELRDWNDGSGIRIVNALDGRWDAMAEHAYYDLDPSDVASWIKAHRPDAAAEPERVEDATKAVVVCIEVFPPPEVRVKSRLAQTGAQKIVFDADWQLGQEHRSVVLKKFIGESEQLVLRESRNHPLVMQHPNIISTYRVRNAFEEDFLVESKLTVVLNDHWSALGYHEAALLLADIARALAFLDGQGYVHGDVKPDNIGSENGNFVLLDFGICRPWVKFLQLDDGTGSLRTRAPEVLQGTSRHSARADVWSLGATIFRALPEIGRFPLYETADESPPHAELGSEEAERLREEFRQVLCERVMNDWTRLVHQPIVKLKKKNLRFGELLEAMLELDPARRISAGAALDEALRHLGGLIGQAEGPLFPPLQEARQFARYLSRETSDLRAIPRAKYTVWNERIDDLEEGLEAEKAEEQLSAELLKCCDELKDQLNSDALAAVDDLGRDLRSHAGDTPLYEELLKEVRNRIDIAASPGTKRAPQFLDTCEDSLADSLEHASRFDEVSGHKNFRPVADALLAILREDT